MVVRANLKCSSRKGLNKIHKVLIIDTLNVYGPDLMLIYRDIVFLKKKFLLLRKIYKY